MTDQIVLLQASDFDELVAFLDAAFEFGPKTSFPVLIPALYQPTDEHMRCNYAIRRQGKLAAVVGLFPITLRVGNAILRIAGIGSVSVGHTFRRQGLMQELMCHITEQIRHEQYHLAFLGGQRQRYRFFGWERAGLNLHVEINRANLRHTFGDQAYGVRLEQVNQDHSLIDRLKAIHDAQPWRCERKHFDRFLHNWLNQPVMALDQTGDVLGYVVFNRNGTQIVEHVASDDNRSMQIVQAAVESREQHSIKVICDPLPSQFNHRLIQWCESMHLAASGNWQVFDWPHVITTMLRARHEAAPLPIGSVVVAVADHAFRMTIDSQGPSCEPSDDAPDITGDGPMITRLLFGPLKPSMVTNLPDTAWVLEAWCPLPLRLPNQDHV